MTREQIVHLRPGQLVRAKITPNILWKIARVLTPRAGERVLELEPAASGFLLARIFVGAMDIEIA